MGPGQPLAVESWLAPRDGAAGYSACVFEGLWPRNSHNPIARRVLRGTFDDDDGVIGVDDDPDVRTAPLGALTGLWLSRRAPASVRGDFGDGDACCFFVDDGVVGGEGGGERV